MKHVERATVTNSPQGVVVKTKNETFCISLRNAALMDYNEAAMKYRGQLPTQVQAQIMCLHWQTINAALTKAGGDLLDRWYWSNDERDTENAFCFFGTGQIKWIGGDKKTSWHYIRPITSIENGKQTICN